MIATTRPPGSRWSSAARKCRAAVFWSSPRDCEIENGGFITITLGRSVPAEQRGDLRAVVAVDARPGNRPSSRSARVGSSSLSRHCFTAPLPSEAMIPVPALGSRKTSSDPRAREMDGKARQRRRGRELLERDLVFAAHRVGRQLPCQALRACGSRRRASMRPTSSGIAMASATSSASKLSRCCQAPAASLPPRFA
jgi:hypothetical protein